MFARTKKLLGFTLVELIMVIIIATILAIYVASLFFDARGYQSRGFADQVQASLRYAQKIAIAQHRYVCVVFTLNSIALSTSVAGTCDTPLPSLTGDANYIINAPDGITFTALPAGLSFDALGKPTNAPQTIRINGAASAITVEAETGYVHQ